VSPTRKRPPGRPAGATGDRTRERILNAALVIFARQGLAGTSVRDIARQARIRVSTLYHHFASKEALYRQVQERVHGRVRELVVSVLGQGLDLRETTRACVGALFDLFRSNPAFMQLGYRTALDDPGPSDADRRIADRWVGLLEGVLTPAEARGEVKDVDPVLFMVTIDGLVHWHIVHDGLYRHLLGRGLDDPELARRVRDHVTAVALRTLGLE
jgi:TetR/AcrR family transcriptional regulator